MIRRHIVVGRRRKQATSRPAVIAASLAALIPSEIKAGDAALGEYLSSECVTCHQLSGDAAGGIPPIIGLPEDHFIKSLKAYKTGERDNEVMRNIASNLTTEDMAALAAFFASQAEKHQ